MRKAIYAAISILSISLLLSKPVSAVQLDATWIGGTANWNSILSWFPTVVPNNNGLLTYNVFIDNGSGTASVATLNTNATIDNLTIDSDDILQIAGTQSLTVVAGAGTGLITNQGILRLLSTSGSTTLVTSGGDVTLAGSGIVDLTAANTVITGSATDRFINQSNTIQGRGNIGNNIIAITNQGVINASVNSATMTVNPGSGGFINTGTLRASNGGTLSLTGGTYTNTGGLIEALTGSHVDFSTVTVTDGTLTSSGTGDLRVTASSTFNNITNTGAMKMNGGSIISTFTGTITNNGTLAVTTTFNNNDVRVSGGDVTFTGSGTLNSTSAAGRIVGAAVTDRFINDTNHTISGAWSIGANGAGLVNRGMLNSNISGLTTTMDPSSAGVTNTGTMQASNGGILAVTGGTYTNTGGLIQALTGSHVDFNAATVVGGTLTSAGTGDLRVIGSSSFSGITNNGLMTMLGGNIVSTFAGSNTNNGTLSLSNSFNTLDVQVSGGDVSFTGTGSFTFAGGGSRIVGAAATDRFINEASHTVQGVGQIGANTMGVVNRGMIHANVSAGTMTLDPNGLGFVNSGTMQASNNGILVLSSGTFSNFEGATDGLIRANAGTVRIQSSTVTGGNVDVVGAGTLELSTAVLRATVNNSSTGLVRAATGTVSTLGGTFNNPLGGLLQLESVSTLILENTGSYTNAGTIRLLNAANSTILQMSGGDVTLSGGGVVDLSTGNVIITGAVASDRLINQDNTIQGRGKLGNNLMGLVNAGVVHANLSGVTMTVNPSSSGVTNTGVLRASNGGTLALTDGTYTNTGGLIEALTGSHVDFNAATVTGGTLTSSGTGDLRVTVSSTFNNITNTGAMKMNGGSIVSTFTGTNTNDGTFAVTTTFNNNDVRVSGGDVTFTGSGTLSSTGSAGRIIGAAITDRFVNDTSHTISGAWQIGANLAGILNRGMINSNLSTLTTTIDPSSAGVTNTGTMQASNSGILLLTGGAYTNTSGLIQALNGSHVDFNGATVTGGTLTSSGTGDLRVIGSSTFNNITNTGAMKMNGGSIVSTFTGTNTNNGTFTVTTTFNNLDIQASGGDVTFTGGGTLSSTGSAGRIVGGVATDRFINDTNHTISGAWQLGANLAGILNRGLIDANIAATTTTVDPSSAGVTNIGTMQASNGAILLLANGTFTNTGALVQALTGSHVDFSAATVTGGTLTSSGTGDLRILGTSSVFTNVTNTGAMVMSGGSLTGTFTGTFTNNGTFAVTTTSNTNDVRVSGGDVTFAGTGVMSSGSIAGRMVGAVTTDRFINDTNHTVSGAWQIGVNTMGLTNRGLINASINATTTTIDPSSAGVTNTGTMQASNGAILSLTGGVFTNTGGIIQALNGSRVDFSTGATITGGTLTSAGTGELRMVASNTFNDITNSGNFTMSGALVGTFTGSNTNNGTITMTPGGSNLDLRVSGGNVTFGGTGVIQMNTNNNNRIIGALSTDRFINGPLHTIQGRGQIIALLTNNGTVDANVGSGIILSLDTNAKINNGVFRASNAAILDVNTPVSGTGRWEAASGGKLQIDAVVTTTGNIDVLGSELEINANMSAHDLHMEPSGILDVNGTSQLTLSGSLSFEMTSEAQWDWTATSDLIMTGGVGATTSNFANWETLELGGLDIGTDPANHVGAPAGFSNNFDLSELVIGIDAHIYLVDLFDNGNRGGPFGTPEALYVDTLRFADTTGRLNLNGLHIYYATLIGNLSQIIDMPTEVDEPPVVWVLVPGLLLLLRKMRLRYA